ncbi:hypothetical protein D3C81_1448390 [compost metagenome]
MLGAAIGLPVAVGHGWCGTAHFAVVAAQFAKHFARVGELAAQRASARGDHGNAEQGGIGLVARPGQRAACPRQQQHNADGEPDGQAWYQLPPVQAHFQQCPCRAAQQHQAVQAQGKSALSQQQCARDGKADTGDQVIQRPAELAELDAARQQGQAHQ